MEWLKPYLLAFIFIIFAINNVKSDTVTNTDVTRIDTNTRTETLSPTIERVRRAGSGDGLTEREKKNVEEAGHRAMDEAQRGYPDSPRTDRSMPVAERSRVHQEWLKEKKAADDLKSRPDTSNSYNSNPSHNSKTDADSSSNHSGKSHTLLYAIIIIIVFLLICALIIGGVVACCIRTHRRNMRYGGNMPIYVY